MQTTQSLRISVVHNAGMNVLVDKVRAPMQPTYSSIYVHGVGVWYQKIKFIVIKLLVLHNYGLVTEVI